MRLMAVAAACLLAALGAGSAAAQQRPPPQVVSYGFWSPSYALAQQRVMNQALASLQPRVPGKRNVYVLSAALYGQHVFEHEAAGAANVLQSHFGAAGHTIVLSNNHAVGAPPFAAASPANLQAALGRLAELMDKENDVAVIFLTSHGAQRAGVLGFETVSGVSTEPLSDYQLAPGRLRGSLDAAGIKNRIIILSACFSGQFIPTLQDPNTIVLTAASAERTSFGCQAQNDWTYFGDAMFNAALPKSNSLLAAFDAAKKQISAEETQGNLTPSQPQIFVGDQAGKFLKEIEQR